METIATSVSHWGETRAQCEPPHTCTPGCVEPCVSLQVPDGYLAEGATFAGHQITGPPSKTAVDRVVELDEEVDQLRQENAQLIKQLEMAQQTVEEQGQAIDTASKELQHALLDYAEVRNQLEKWDNELEVLNGEVRQNFDQQRQLLRQFEMELEGLLQIQEMPVSEQTAPVPQPTQFPEHAPPTPPKSTDETAGEVTLSFPMPLPSNTAVAPVMNSPVTLQSPESQSGATPDATHGPREAGVSLVPPSNLDSRRPVSTYQR